jgi:hypothetical protein
MTDETATPSAEAAKESKPRQPRLTVTYNGETQPLLKYPFPVKAATFPVTVNGAPAVAACTAGRGKAYTYILFNNTSFYVPGTIPVDASLTVVFPENYKFDDVKAVRTSTYKPKKTAKKGENGESAEAPEVSAEGQAEEQAKTEPEPQFVQPQVMEEHGHKISRRNRGASAS